MKIRIAAAALILLLAVLLSACGSTAPEGVAVPADMKLISPDTADYYLFVPDDWRSDISTGVVTAYYSDSDPTNISMMVFSLGGEEMTYAQYWDRYSEQFSEIYDGYELSESGETVLGGVSAGKYVYSGKFAQKADDASEGETANDDFPAAGEYKFQTVVAIRGGNIYILTYSAKASVYESHIGDFEDIQLNFLFK